MTWITLENLAKLQLLIKKSDRKLSEFELMVELHKPNKHFMPVSLRTLQRMKHKLRKMSHQEKQELVICYYDYSLKLKLWMENDIHMAYENFCKQLGLVKIPISIMYPYLPKEQQRFFKRMEKWKKQSDRLIDKAEKMVYNIKKRGNKTKNKKPKTNDFNFNSFDDEFSDFDLDEMYNI